MVILYTDETSDSLKVTVPDFTGLSVSQANTLATNSNINISFAGASQLLKGVISYKQSIPEGTKVDAGTIVTVYFRTTETAE